jgi:hypothetical protein
VWEVARGGLTLEDVAGETSRFLQAKSGAGQAGQALRELRDVLDGLKGKSIEAFEAKLFLEKGDAALDRYLAAQAVASLGKDAKVSVVSEGVTDPSTVFEDKVDVPWEVDEFWAKLRADVPHPVRLQARLLVVDRAGDPGTQGPERPLRAHQDCRTQAGPVEEVQVLHGPQPVAPRAVPRGRDLPA